MRGDILLPLADDAGPGGGSQPGVEGTRLALDYEQYWGRVATIAELYYS